MVNKHFTVVWGMVLMLSMIVLFGCDNLPTIDLSSDAPPDAPIDFQATPGDGQVTLKWTSPSNTGIKDGVTAAISGYKVYWSTESDVKIGREF